MFEVYDQTHTYISAMDAILICGMVAIMNYERSIAPQNDGVVRPFGLVRLFALANQHVLAHTKVMLSLGIVVCVRPTKL